MTLYTRKGDSGKTTLANGRSISKDAVRIEAYGAVDEVSSWIGSARSFNRDPQVESTLEFLLHRFFNVSADLAAPAGSELNRIGVSVEDVAFLEEATDFFESETDSLSGFILPGGGRCAGFLHIARTVCRRAERRIWTLYRSGQVDETLLIFVNRASDLLFAAARFANETDGEGDVLWNHDFPVPKLSR
jgi:cob(I)alamin adenosyltransferase